MEGDFLLLTGASVNPRYKYFTRHKMISALRQAAQEVGEPLTQLNFKQSEACAGLEPKWIIMRFSTWSGALSQAGLQSVIEHNDTTNRRAKDESRTDEDVPSQMAQGRKIAQSDELTPPPIHSSRDPETEFIQYLKDQRKQLGLSQIRLSRMIDKETDIRVVDAYIRLVENGSRIIEKPIIKVIKHIFQREAIRQNQAKSWETSFRSFLDD